ncbi:hypothetical protein PPYR_05148 [Photinus pyralis]|uniref:Uncharacterized protein n=1 Tax=Photinus pyralis TaxID=7054 RepID=A0A5N4B040_PHOPY|nr:cohesin subunit SA-1-like [Photinus pyralis]KAB0802962.1 hypothetical protein PPYR_05148 [Photinus pyralis]
MSERANLSPVASQSLHSFQKTCSTPKKNGVDVSKYLDFEDLSEVERASDDGVTVRERKRKITTTQLALPTVNESVRLSTRLMPFVRNESANTSSTSNVLGLSESESERNIKTRKVIRKGEDWVLFKPRNHQSLFGSIITNSNGEEEAIKWVQLYHKQPDKAIVTIIQFILDACGYEEFSLTEKFQMDHANYVELLNHLQHHPPQLQLKTGKYLFNTRSGWGKFAQESIFQFVQTLIGMIHQHDILYGKDFAHVFAVILSISKSVNRALRHVGVVLTIKIYTTILTLCTQLEKKNINHRRKDKNILLQLLLLLQDCIEANCHLNDVQLNAMKITFLHEMCSWFQIDPTLFDSTKYFNRLMWLVQDTAKQVRIAALKICRELITNDCFSEHMANLYHTMCGVVANRVYDIDYSVAVSAVQILTTILDRYGEILPEQIRNKVILLVYGKHGLLAKAAGEFLIKTLLAKDTDMEFLRKFTLFASVNKPQLVPLLIDATLDFWPVISYWPKMIDWLLSDKSTTEMAPIVIEIMSDSVQQCVTGKCSINRMKPCTNETKTNSLVITKVFITNMSSLLRKYKEDSKCVELLVNIILLMHFQEVVLTNSSHELDAILFVLRPVFVKETNRDTLDVISRFFCKLCETTFSQRHQYISKIKTLQFATKDALSNSVKQLNKDEAEPWMIRMLSLIKHCDMQDVLDFKFLFDSAKTIVENQFPTKVIEDALKACHHSLCWQLTSIIEIVFEEDSVLIEENIHKVKNDFNAYIDYCVKILQHLSDNTYSAAFECICETYSKFHHGLKDPSKIKEILCELIPPAFKPTDSQYIMDYCQKSLFNDYLTEETIRMRRTSLANVMRLVLIHSINTTEIVKLYTYYNSHNKDYGDIFDSGLKTIHEKSPVTNIGIVLQCLIYKFTQLVVNDTEETRMELQALSKRFQLIMNRWTEQSYQLVSMGIKYSVKSQTHYQFLNYVKYFTVSLSTKEKIELVNKLISNIPEKNREDAAVQVFICYTKNKKDPQQSAARKLSSTTTTSDTLEIEDDKSQDMSPNSSIENNEIHNSSDDV